MTKTPDLPSIVKRAEQVTKAVEIAVRAFARRDRYLTGSDLREDAMEVWRLSIKAWRNRQARATAISTLSGAIDDLKLRLQLASSIGAFRSKAEFAAIAVLVRDLGRQCGGWLKQHANGQNPGRQQHAGPERPLRLGTRAAPQLGANP